MNERERNFKILLRSLCVFVPFRFPVHGDDVDKQHRCVGNTDNCLAKSCELKRERERVEGKGASHLR